MKITNKLNLPQPLVNAVSNWKPQLGKIGVTTLIGSPQERMLRYHHWDEIEEDASDRIWALLGTSVHYLLEKAAEYSSCNVLAEEYLETEYRGMTVRGIPDLLDSIGILDDYKVTSVWSFILGDKKEWEAQLNINAWLYRLYGFKVNKLRIVAILRDWKQREAKLNPDYPQSQVLVKDIPSWTDFEIHQYLDKRIDLHKEAEQGNIQPCTDDEMWKRSDIWAVKKKGNKRSLRNFESEKEAIDFQESCGFTTEIEFRPGECVKCESYCNVVKWCKQKNDN